MAFTPEQQAAIAAAAAVYERWRHDNPPRPWPPFDQMQAIPYQGSVLIVCANYPALVINGELVEVKTKPKRVRRPARTPRPPVARKAVRPRKVR